MKLTTEEIEAFLLKCDAESATALKQARKVLPGGSCDDGLGLSAEGCQILAYNVVLNELAPALAREVLLARRVIEEVKLRDPICRGIEDAIRTYDAHMAEHAQGKGE